ncbi:FAD-dependent oxidoreductase [Oxalobacteraceae bacterium]|nr:FAD-dependent oxidoreductase [Oxalobacteraceae bacterium]
MTRHFDVLVIGAGPAGLAAAHAAAAHGMQVGLVDDNPLAGGQIWRGGPEHQSDQRACQLWDALRCALNVRFLPQTRVLYSPRPGQLLVQIPDRALLLRYSRLILATGARELLLPFPGWTLPGVTGAGGLQALAKGGYPVAGKRVVLAGSGPLLLASAATLADQGARIVAIIEQASTARLLPFAFGLLATPSKITQALQLASRLRAVPYWRASFVRAATSGNTAGSSSRANTGERNNGGFGADNSNSGTALQLTIQRGVDTATLDCDYLACGYGLLPNTELAQSLGCASNAHGVQVDEWQRSSVADIYCAGESTGIGGVDLALAEGRIAGLAATGQQEEARRHFAERARWRGFASRLAHAFLPRPELSALAADDTIVCRCEDVCHGELRQHDSWRSAKLHTRCGMGPCQGRICGGATGLLYGWRPDSVRVPIVPARAGSIIDFQ